MLSPFMLQRVDTEHDNRATLPPSRLMCWWVRFQKQILCRASSLRPSYLILYPWPERQCWWKSNVILTLHPSRMPMVLKMTLQTQQGRRCYKCIKGKLNQGHLISGTFVKIYISDEASEEAQTWDGSYTEKQHWLCLLRFFIPVMQGSEMHIAIRYGGSFFLSACSAFCVNRVRSQHSLYGDYINSVDWFCISWLHLNMASLSVDGAEAGVRKYRLNKNNRYQKLPRS